MSFSEQRKMMSAQTRRSVLSPFEQEYLGKEDFDYSDKAVENLVDRICAKKCLFAFKVPLKRDFYTAKDHALNCLEVVNISPRKVKDWISNCIKCMDCILLVYMRDVLKEAVPPQREGRPRERELYDKYEEKDGDLEIIGICFNSVYQVRSSLEHVHEVGDGGNRYIKELSGKKKMSYYELSVKQVEKALGVIVPLYRTAFPACCMFANEQL